MFGRAVVCRFANLEIYLARNIALQFVFEKRLPIRPLLDEFQTHGGNAARHGHFDRESAAPGRRPITIRSNDIRPLQAITSEPAFPADLGTDARDCFAAARKAPALDEENFAICFPFLRQIEREGQIIGDLFRVEPGFARAMEKLPKRFDRAPRGRTLNLLEQILSVFQARSGIGAFDLVDPRFLFSPIEPRLCGR